MEKEKRRGFLVTRIYFKYKSQDQKILGRKFVYFRDVTIPVGICSSVREGTQTVKVVFVKLKVHPVEKKENQASTLMAMFHQKLYSFSGPDKTHDLVDRLKYASEKGNN